LEFEKWFRDRTRRFEVFLVRAALFCLFLLLTAQLVLTIPAARNFVSLVDRWEGRPYSPPAETSGPGPAAQEEGEQYLVLKIDSITADTLVEVLVNGHSVIDFSRERTVRVPVREGDLVEIDGDMPDRAIEVAVSAVSEGLAFPESGRIVTFNGILETVGQVVARHND